MEDSYINNTSVDKNYNNSNTESGNTTDITNLIENVVTCIIISIGLPLILVTIYGLYTQVRKDHVAPIYIINLLVSDLIQLCSMIVHVAKPENHMITKIFNLIYIYGLMTSVSFMVCIALERYLVIAWPLWYRFRRNIKTTVVVCVVVWILPLLFVLPRGFGVQFNTMIIIFGVFLLLPFPLFIFSLFGTVKALSAAISVPPDEKRRIAAILVLVLLIYTLLFLPTIIVFLVEEARNYVTFFVSDLLANFSPLADLFLYVFSRKGVVDRFLAFVCRCRMNSDSDVTEMSGINS